MVNAVLHLGAHRCATTSFQSYLDRNSSRLQSAGIAVWTPKITRGGLFQDLFCPPEFNGPEVQESLQRVQGALDGTNQDKLLVSEENMIGSPRDNIDQGVLYPQLLPRMARYKLAFSGHLTGIGLTIRSYEAYWASLLSFALLRGLPLPCDADLTAMAEQQRRWQHMIADLKVLFPKTPIQIARFEDTADKPNRLLNRLIGPIPVHLDRLCEKKNYSRDTTNLRRLLCQQGRDETAKRLPTKRQKWMPFSPLQQLKMQAAYAQDIAWLRSNTDPLITYHDKAAAKVPHRSDTGERHEFKRQMGRAGREGTAWQAT